jgi:hypothetical protein
MAKLHVLSGVMEGRTFELIDEKITVGRSLDNMITLEDGTVSHHHAVLVVDNGDYKLRDLNSTNGTRVNGLRVVETRLHNGDQVRFGSVEMRYECDTKKASQPLPPPKVGVDPAEIGKGGSPPPNFGPVSPFGRKRQTAEPSTIKWVVIGLGVVAAGLLAYLVYTFFS